MQEPSEGDLGGACAFGRAELFHHFYYRVVALDCCNCLDCVGSSYYFRAYFAKGKMPYFALFDKLFYCSCNIPIGIFGSNLC